jgi:hypothetical protein
VGPIYASLIWWQRCTLIPDGLYVLLLLYAEKFFLSFLLNSSSQELHLFGTKLKGVGVVKRREYFTVPINTASQYLLLQKPN